MRPRLICIFSSLWCSSHRIAKGSKNCSLPFSLSLSLSSVHSLYSSVESLSLSLFFESLFLCTLDSGFLLVFKLRLILCFTWHIRDSRWVYMYIWFQTHIEHSNTICKQSTNFSRQSDKLDVGGCNGGDIFRFLLPCLLSFGNVMWCLETRDDVFFGWDQMTTCSWT